jgi:hypothetical protein
MAATLAASHLDLWKMHRREADGCMRESWGDQAAIEAGEKKVELARVPSVLSWTSKQRETEDSMLTTCEDPRVSRHAGDPEELCFRNKKSCSYNLERRSC